MSSRSPVSPDGRAADDAARHVLPVWVQWVQSHLFLSFLLLAEAYLLGDLMARGWVANIEDPGDWFAHWGVYHGVGVILFFAAGATASGVALGCSVMAAQAFSSTPRRWGFGLFNFIGVSAFAVAEIWASLSERSANLAPTPADNAVLHLVGATDLPVSPTVVIIALLLPFATLFWGFSQQQKPPVEDDADREARERAELARAKHQAALLAVKAGSANQAWGALRGTFNPLGDAGSSGMNGGDDGPAGAGLSGMNDDERTADSGGQRRRSGQVRSLRSVPASLMTATQLRAWLRDELGVVIRDEEATAFVRSLPGASQLTNVRGAPWAASKTAVKTRARQKWAAVPAGKVAGD